MSHYPTVDEQSHHHHEVKSGTRVTIELEGRYQRGRGSVDEYLEQTAIANPHVTIHYIDPDGGETTYTRSTTELPPEPVEIKPHPYGIEFGQLVTMLKDSHDGTMAQFLTTSFSRVSPSVAQNICEAAKITHAIASETDRSSRGGCALSGDSNDQDQRAGDRLHLPDRRAADPERIASSVTRRILFGRDAPTRGVSRRSFRHRGRLSLRWHQFDSEGDA